MTRASIRALVDAATPGPWRADVDQPDDVVVWGPEEPEWLANVGNWSRAIPGPPASTTDRAFQTFELRDMADAAFIAASRTAVPLLLAVADAAEEALVDLESAYHLVPGYCDCLPPGCMAPSIYPLRDALAALEATR